LIDDVWLLKVVETVFYSCSSFCCPSTIIFWSSIWCC